MDSRSACLCKEPESLCRRGLAWAADRRHDCPTPDAQQNGLLAEANRRRIAMGSAGFIQRLQAELRREAKKTAVLALLFLVGLWFWLPPLYRRLRGPAHAQAAVAADQDSSQQTSDQADSGKETPAARRKEGEGQEPDSTDWRVERERLDNLSILQPADWNDHVRDPFSREWISRQVAERKKAEAAKAKTKTEESIQLNKVKLSSTAVGPGMRAAIINDRIYKVGDQFPREPMEGFPTLLVVDISPDSVVFEHKGKRYTVRLERKN